MLRFRAFGIPVTVDTWFLLGMFFIFSLAGGGRPGTFAAVAIAVFTLVHELGHALTARHYGCAVEIRLNFLMGWAAFTSVRPLSRLERIVISLAGPLAGLGAGLITLAAIHTAHARAASPATQLLLADLWQGVAWAAIVISLLNLLPLWPLDGGHVVHKLIEAPLGERRSLRVMAIATLVGCAALVVLSVLAGQRTGIVADWRRHGLGQYQNPFSHGLVGALWGSVTSAPSVVLGGIYFIPLVCGVSSMQLLAALKSPSSAGPSVGWVGVTEASGSRPAASSRGSQAPSRPARAARRARAAGRASTAGGPRDPSRAPSG